MTTPVAITLTALSAPSDTPTTTASAVEGSPFADILALLSQPASKQALLQSLQSSAGVNVDAQGLPSALLGRLSQLDAQQRQTLLSQLRAPTHDGVTPLPDASFALLPTAPAATDSPRAPDVNEAGAQQAIAALLAMLPARGDVAHPTALDTGAIQQEAPGRLRASRQEAHAASLSHLLETTRGDERANAHPADVTPLLQAKTSPTTPGINRIDTGSTLLSLETPNRRVQSHEGLVPPHAQSITPTALHHAANLAPATPQVNATPLASPASASAPLLNAPLGSSEWQQALGQQVLMFSRNGQHQAELRLHPQDLGALQISLRLDDNQAQLHLAAAHSQVRAALEAALPHLRTALAESGIQLGQSSVGSEAQSQWGGGQQQRQESAAGAVFSLADNTLPLSREQDAPTVVRRHLGAVDISV
ncbi:flagellar hook-length control protein FliK [Edwardsiella hoshinae]|uniref:Flagellar hook-length control protein n=1 Tax=Edwardsiella hoshinae TaxID=93378 RepID=A0A376DCK7_9GAMM|nr:flagellar hook-length control protein FliK [Edwardsiella hoshinae]QPR27505.1 flagellar hook-length control protein FliK [Edwardsiella hoshinae]STC87048.1 Flagellar hook-length control protein [Edwardsiella hoshinae]